MALTNAEKDREYIDKLVEMKRYYRSDTKFQELVDKADEALKESDYDNSWRIKRNQLFQFLKDYFQLEKDGSYIKLTDTTETNNKNIHSFNIEIYKSPIDGKYAIGTNEEIEIQAKDISKDTTIK